MENGTVSHRKSFGKGLQQKEDKSVFLSAPSEIFLQTSLEKSAFLKMEGIFRFLLLTAACSYNICHQSKLMSSLKKKCHQSQSFCLFLPL